jgi:hypothetical protein
LTNEVVTPKIRATAAPEYPDLLAATWLLVAFKKIPKLAMVVPYYTAEHSISNWGKTFLIRRD